jgi:hypothetical protein
MAVIITIFKSQLSENPKLLLDLAEYASETSILEEAFIHVSKAGQLMDLVNLLNKSGVDYNINSEGVIT